MGVQVGAGPRLQGFGRVERKGLVPGGVDVGMLAAIPEEVAGGRKSGRDEPGDQEEA
jgi:hypothetical protein